ncbi:MAG: acetylxylan esterase [Planctomycetota bacterium]
MRASFVCLFACLSVISNVAAEDSLVTGDSSKLITLNDHFPFRVPASTEQWEERRAALKQRVLVATGLYPFPEKTPLQSVTHGRVDREGFFVERVYFQSLPGHFVSGMVFRPSDDNRLGLVDGRRPAVLSPHGHSGRKMRLTDQELERQLKDGGERFSASGRYPKLARCGQLARMGCVVLIFDMLGFGDSLQIAHAVAHGHSEAREAENNRESPCFYSIDADLNAQSVMGLQTWNAIRALDFLESQPDVDPKRLGVTGGSGGGTQTILLGAIDARVRASFPNGMVSTSMQGGCFCENCNYLRIGTGNVELAALFAPKPQGMTAADDWTVDMLTDGYPELKSLYALLGVPENVMCGDVLKYPHNYNYVTRSMMYPWMAKHLELHESPLEELDFEPFSEEQLTVWNEQHPAPTQSGVEHEQSVLRWWSEQSDAAIRAWIPDVKASKEQQQQSWGQYNAKMASAWSVIFDRQLPRRQDLQIETISKTDGGVRIDRIKHPAWKTEVIVRVFHAAKDGSTKDSSAKRSIFVTRPDEAATADRDGFGFVAKPLLETDDVEFVVPLLLAAENVSEDESGMLQGQQRLVDDSRSYSGFTFCYNRPLVVKRFEQILCVIAAYEAGAETSLIADGGGLAASAAGAAMVAGPIVDEFFVQLDGFRFNQVQDYRDQYFLPASGKYLGIEGLLSLRAPYPLAIADETDDSMPLLRNIYQSADASDQLRLPLELNLD